MLDIRLSFSQREREPWFFEYKDQGDGDSDLYKEIVEIEESRDKKISLQNCSQNEIGFVFVDGVLDKIGEGKIKISERESEFLLFSMCVGCGFENGQLIEKNIENIFWIVEDQHINEIKEIERKTECKIIATREARYAYSEILQTMREKEIKMALKVSERMQNISKKIMFFILDGPIYHTKLDELKNRGIFCGIVKNPEKLYGTAKEEISELKIGERTKLKKVIFSKREELSKKEKFFFFMKVGKHKQQLIRVDFLPEDEEKLEPFSIAEILKEKISMWASDIGDRAPENLTPIRILENRLRAIKGDKKIIQRKIKNKIELPLLP
ncbi:hypothetical protein HRbin19_00723 [bacterium HR19]|nr:hypothetical protein HRbin19_00723 [bacterium HR19]